MSPIAESASASNSALIRLDIKRRDALTGAVASPLLGLIKPGTTPRNHDQDLPVPTALDLPDVTAADVTPRPRPTPTLTRADRKHPPRPGPDPGPVRYRPRRRRLPLTQSPGAFTSRL